MNSLQLNVKPTGELTVRATDVAAIFLAIAVGVGIGFYLAHRTNNSQFPAIKPTQLFLDAVLKQVA